MHLRRWAEGALSRVDREERSQPADAAAAKKQWQLMEAIGLRAHAAGGRTVDEASLREAVEVAPALQEGWAMVRRKLSRGSIPLLCVEKGPPTLWGSPAVPIHPLGGALLRRLYSRNEVLPCLI